MNGRKFSNSVISCWVLATTWGGNQYNLFKQNSHFGSCHTSLHLFNWIFNVSHFKENFLNCCQLTCSHKNITWVPLQASWDVKWLWIMRSHCASWVKPKCNSSVLHLNWKHLSKFSLQWVSFNFLLCKGTVPFHINLAHFFLALET